MSLGGSSSKQSSTSTGQTYYDPAQTGMVDQFAQGVAAAGAPGGALAYKPYTGPGLSFGDQGPLQGLLNFKAPQAVGVGYNASTIDPSSVPNVTAGQLATTDLSPYLNPYTQDVANTTISQAMRAKGIGDVAAQGQATQAGAFGGSRSAVLQNLNDASWQQNLQSTLAGINQQGFTQAQQAAQQDISGRLQAAQGNQQAGLTIGQANIGAENAAKAAGATAANTASLANQQAGIQGAQVIQNALGISDQQAQQIFGANWQQYLNSQTDPQAIQQLITQAYSLIPTGALSSQNAKSSGSSGSFNFALPMPAP
jgi:hypothetical protein